MEGSGGVNHTGISNFISEIDRVTPKKTEQQTKVKLVFDKAVSTLQETVSKIRPTTKVPEADRTQLIDTIEKFNSEVSSTHDLDSIDVNELKRIKHFVKTTYLRKTPQGKEALLWIESLKIIDKIKTHPESAKDLYKDDASVAQQLALFLLLKTEVNLDKLYETSSYEDTPVGKPIEQVLGTRLSKIPEDDMKSGDEDIPKSKNQIKNLLTIELNAINKFLEKGPQKIKEEQSGGEVFIDSLFAAAGKGFVILLAQLVENLSIQKAPEIIQKEIAKRIIGHMDTLSPKLAQGQQNMLDMKKELMAKKSNVFEKVMNEHKPKLQSSQS